MTLKINSVAMIRVHFELLHQFDKLSTNCIQLRLLQRSGKWVHALQHRVFRYRYAIVMRLHYPRVMLLALALS